ncbi:hypothetical protein [Priestia megaterium]|uniref:hypothetical protein n=1 Tax=Priestia megaterium TaxID=1404 RepID=UPI002E23008C|nr:hypothetical protein [Priestia megaterium]
MAEVYNMKALSTFYGTGGYIVAGQEFFTTSKAQADAYYHQGKAVYTDGTEPAEPEHNDLKLQAKYRNETPEKETEFKTSELERNVTSMANPVNIKISVDGVNPEDLNVEVVRDEKVEEETVVVQENPEKVANHGEQPQARQQQQAQPQQQQQAQPQETSQQPQYSQQNQQPQQQQAQSQQQNEEERASQELQSQEQQLIQQLNEIRAKQEELKKNDSTKEQPVDSQNSKFEARHVGGGWYDLPNGERVQGKDNAENRLNEIANAYQYQQQNGADQLQAQSQQNENVGKFHPNADRVRQANTPVEDGASLNQAQLETYSQTTESGSLSGWNGEQENQAQGQAQQSNQGEQAQAGMAGGSTGSTGGNAGGGNTGGSTGGGNTGQ